MHFKTFYFNLFLHDQVIVFLRNANVKRKLNLLQEQLIISFQAHLSTPLLLLWDLLDSQVF